MKIRALKGFTALLCLLYSCAALSGYRTFLDPRAMAMGGAGVASSTKFNAAFHNPAMIAFNRGDLPDKIYISASQGIRELYNHDLEKDVNNFQDEEFYQDFVDSINTEEPDVVRSRGEKLLDALGEINLSSFRKDETTAFSLLVDTRPVTISFYTSRDIREMTTIRNRDVESIDEIITSREQGRTINRPEDQLLSSVDNTYFEISEFGVTVATTNVIDYNMPISWGFTPKLLEIRGSHIATKIDEYDVTNPPQERVSTGLLEWNLDVGLAVLLTNEFLESELGLDGWWLEGEWVFGVVGMNLFPTDFTPFRPLRPSTQFPGTKRAVQALYQIGLAHYREDYMLTLDIDLDEHEVYDFEGLTRFVSLGGEYYWRDDFHLRAGVRINTAQPSEAAKDQAILTTGFLYQNRGFSIEGSAMFNDIEVGGTVGFGLAF